MTLCPSRRGHALEGVSRRWTSVSGSSPACSTARRWRALCAEFGISRKTGYKIYDRYKDCGVDGPDRPQPPALPARQPAAAGDREADRAAEAGVSELGRARRFASGCGGAVPDVRCPAISTVHAVLDRHGLVTRRAAPPASRRGHAALARRTSRMTSWCADYKGEFMLADRRYCYPLTITDFASRYLLTCEALSTTKELYAFTVFERVFKEFGLPRAIRTDNGVPFASPNALYGLSKLSVWWLRLGIQIERIKPGHPEQNGRHERMHLTLKQEATKPAAANVLQQQARFDAFIDALQPASGPTRRSACRCPASVYTPSPRPYRGLERPRLPVARLDGDRHPLRPHLLQAPEGQSESGVCRAEGGRAAGERARSGSSPSWTTISATSTTRRAGSSRSRIRSARKCYPCLRNESVTHVTGMDLGRLAPRAGFEPATLRLTDSCRCSDSRVLRACCSGETLLVPGVREQNCSQIDHETSEALER